MLNKEYTKEKDAKRAETQETWRKRDAKIQEKRDEQKKDMKKTEYAKKQREANKPGKYD